MSQQASLLQLEQSCESAGSQVKLQEKMLSALDCDMEQLQHSVLRLEAQIHSLLLENLELRSWMEEQQQRRHSQQMEFSSYRSRVTEHRTAVCLQESRALLHQELQQKQQEASGLRLTLEELQTDLQKPVRQTQVSLSPSRHYEDRNCFNDV